MFFDEAVNKRGMSLEQFVHMSSTAAAKLYDLYPKKGIIEIGSDADLVIFDPAAKWTVENDKLFYLEKWTPLEGRTVTGRVDETIVRGKTVYAGCPHWKGSGSGREYVVCCEGVHGTA